MITHVSQVDPGISRNPANESQRISSPTVRAVILRDFPPLYTKPVSGDTPTGFAVDLLEELFRTLGFDLELIIAESWEDAIGELRSGNADLIPGIAIIEERKSEFIYSYEVISTPVSFFLRSGRPDISTWTDLAG